MLVLGIIWPVTTTIKIVTVVARVLGKVRSRSNKASNSGSKGVEKVA